MRLQERPRLPDCRGQLLPSRCLRPAGPLPDRAAGLHDARHRVNETGEQVDTWSLAAALLFKHTREPVWAVRAAQGLQNFAEGWANASANGTRPWARSGFVGWTLPMAYQTLRGLGAEPDWPAELLSTFKAGLDDWLNPVLSGLGEPADGIEELGNWNKGFQHLADAAAVLQVFPDVDAWPKNNGVYANYSQRAWRSWTSQHVYPENSVNYNGISAQLIVNVIPDLMGAPTDVTHPATVGMIRRFAHYFNNMGAQSCMPPFGASNGPCESPLLFNSAFERMASATNDTDGLLRYRAQLLFGCNASGCPTAAYPGCDPVSAMLAHDHANPQLPAVKPSARRGEVFWRREARNSRPGPALLPDKLLLSGESSGFAMFELWSTVSLYHEATTQIVGDLLEYSFNGIRHTRSVGRKHAPAVPQGNTIALAAATDPATRRSFPWVGGAGMVTEPAEWQQMVLSTRFLMTESNDMDEYTTRRLDSLALQCDATVNSQNSSFQVEVHGMELIGPAGTRELPLGAAQIWPGSANSSQTPPGRTGSSLLLGCAAGGVTSFARTQPVRATFDIADEYTHLRFWWRTVGPFAFAVRAVQRTVHVTPGAD